MPRGSVSSRSSTFQSWPKVRSWSVSRRTGCARLTSTPTKGSTPTGTADSASSGHEIVGVIEDMGPKTKPRDPFNVGDRVAVNPFVVCGMCTACLRGDQQGCNGTRVRLRYGAVPTEVAPALWGGYATHVYIPPNGILYKVPDGISALDATLWNPISGGYEWAVVRGGIKPATRFSSSALANAAWHRSSPSAMQGRTRSFSLASTATPSSSTSHSSSAQTR